MPVSWSVKEGRGLVVVSRRGMGRIGRRRQTVARRRARRVGTTGAVAWMWESSAAVRRSRTPGRWRVVAVEFGRVLGSRRPRPPASRTTVSPTPSRTRTTDGRTRTPSTLSGRGGERRGVWRAGIATRASLSPWAGGAEVHRVARVVGSQGWASVARIRSRASPERLSLVGRAIRAVPATAARSLAPPRTGLLWLLDRSVARLAQVALLRTVFVVVRPVRSSRGGGSGSSSRSGDRDGGGGGGSGRSSHASIISSPAWTLGFTVTETGIYHCSISSLAMGW